MSNEMKDWLADKQENAKWWLERYPFVRIKNNKVEPWLPIGADDVTWLDDIPDGWVYAFGKPMCDELMEALGEYADKWIILQAKEKFGAMRLYHTGLPESIYHKVEDIIDKYEEISARTCCICGQPATHITTGWICPYCEEHVPTISGATNKDHALPIEEFYTKWNEST